MNIFSVFPTNKVNKMTSFGKMMPGLQYPFLIANTDRSEKDGTHWWSILNISPSKEIFLFNSFGIEGLKNFIIQDDRKIITKVLKGIEKMKTEDSKLTLVKLKFSMKGYSELKQEKVSSLLETAKYFFHFIKSFGENKK